MYDVGYVVWMIILVIESGGSVNMDIVYMLRWGRHVLQMAYHVPVWCKALLFIQDTLMYNFNTHDYIIIIIAVTVSAIIGIMGTIGFYCCPRFGIGFIYRIIESLLVLIHVLFTNLLHVPYCISRVILHYCSFGIHYFSINLNSCSFCVNPCGNWIFVYSAVEFIKRTSLWSYGR